MAYGLITSLHSIFSKKFVEENEYNYRLIDKSITGFKNSLDYHQNKQNPAHNADQIKYVSGSVSDFLKYLNGRFSNMILGHNGDGINEVTDARVANDGISYPTLQDRLYHDYSEFKEFRENISNTVEQNYQEYKETEYRFEPETQEFEFITDLSPYANAVMQSFWFDSKEHIIYMTQANSNKKDYMLTRLKPNGQFIDRTMVRNGGHGTHNAYRYIGNQLWIYSGMTDSNGVYKIVRFTYKTGEIKYGDGTIDVLSSYINGRYARPLYNPKEDVFVLRFANDDSEVAKTKILNRIEIIKASDVDKNTPKVIGKLDIPMTYTNSVQPMQGMTYDDGIVYWYTGDSNPANKNYLTAFSVETGQELYSRPVGIGGVVDKYPGDFQEAEGAAMYYDEDTGRKAMLLGVTTGPRNNRRHSIYSIGQRGINELLNNRISPVLMTDTGGRVKSLPSRGSAYLSDATEIGHFYLYGKDTQNIIDFPLPKEFRDAGWFLDVYPGHYKGALRQVLTRNSTGRNMVKFERVMSIFDKKQNGPWNYIYETAGFWERIPSSIKKLQDLDIAGMTFYITKEESKRFSDFPKDYQNVAGWTLTIEQVSKGVKRQVLKRYNTTANFQMLVRTFSDKAKSKWSLIEGKEVS